jgi:hypothetical protein
MLFQSHTKLYSSQGLLVASRVAGVLLADLNKGDGGSNNDAHEDESPEPAPTGRNAIRETCQSVEAWKNSNTAFISTPSTSEA